MNEAVRSANAEGDACLTGSFRNRQNSLGAFTARSSRSLNPHSNFLRIIPSAGGNRLPRAVRDVG